MMTFDDYLTILIAESDCFANAIAASQPGDSPSSCPEWSTRELAVHVGEVQRWAAFTLNHPGERPPVDVVGMLPAAEELDRWLRVGSSALVNALRDGDPGFAYYTFLADSPPPLLFWARRQVHEVAMHRVDAQIAVGTADPFQTAFAVDGIDEMLTGFAPRKHMKLRSDTPKTMMVAPADSDQTWHVTISNDPVVTVRNSRLSADCVVTGRATDTLSVLWNRKSKESLDLRGDAAVLGLFCDTVQIRWG